MLSAEGEAPAAPFWIRSIGCAAWQEPCPPVWRLPIFLLIDIPICPRIQSHRKLAKPLASTESAGLWSRSLQVEFGWRQKRHKRVSKSLFTLS